MTEQELKEIEARANASTPGPWVIHEDGGVKGWSVISENIRLAVTVAFECTEEDAKLFAHAREDIPKLLAEVKRLQQDNARLRGKLERVGEVLSAAGCDCDCSEAHIYFYDHEEDCERCLGCRIEMAFNPDGSVK